MVYLGQGDLEGARSVIRNPPPGLEPTVVVAYMASFNELYWVLPRSSRISCSGFLPARSTTIAGTGRWPGPESIG